MKDILLLEKLTGKKVVLEAVYDKKALGDTIDRTKLGDIQKQLRSILEKLGVRVQGAKVYTETTKKQYRYKIYSFTRLSTEVIQNEVDKINPEIKCKSLKSSPNRMYSPVYGVNFYIPYSLIT